VAPNVCSAPLPQAAAAASTPLAAAALHQAAIDAIAQLLFESISETAWLPAPVSPLQPTAAVVAPLCPPAAAQAPPVPLLRWAPQEGAISRLLSLLSCQTGPLSPPTLSAPPPVGVQLPTAPRLLLQPLLPLGALPPLPGALRLQQGPQLLQAQPPSLQQLLLLEAQQGATPLVGTGPQQAAARLTEEAAGMAAGKGGAGEGAAFWWQPVAAAAEEQLRQQRMTPVLLQPPTLQSMLRRTGPRMRRPAPVILSGPAPLCRAAAAAAAALGGAARDAGREPRARSRQTASLWGTAVPGNAATAAPAAAPAPMPAPVPAPIAVPALWLPPAIVEQGPPAPPHPGRQRRRGLVPLECGGNCAGTDTEPSSGYGRLARGTTGPDGAPQRASGAYQKFGAPAAAATLSPASPGPGRPSSSGGGGGGGSDASKESWHAYRQQHWRQVKHKPNLCAAASVPQQQGRPAGARPPTREQQLQPRLQARAARVQSEPREPLPCQQVHAVAQPPPQPPARPAAASPQRHAAALYSGGPQHSGACSAAGAPPAPTLRGHGRRRRGHGGRRGRRARRPAYGVLEHRWAVLEPFDGAGAPRPGLQELLDRALAEAAAAAAADGGDAAGAAAAAAAEPGGAVPRARQPPAAWQPGALSGVAMRLGRAAPNAAVARASFKPRQGHSAEAATPVAAAPPALPLRPAEAQSPAPAQGAAAAETVARPAKRQRAAPEVKAEQRQGQRSGGGSGGGRGVDSSSRGSTPPATWATAAAGRRQQGGPSAAVPVPSAAVAGPGPGPGPGPAPQAEDRRPGGSSNNSSCAGAAPAHRPRPALRPTPPAVALRLPSSQLQAGALRVPRSAAVVTGAAHARMGDAALAAPRAWGVRLVYVWELEDVIVPLCALLGNSCLGFGHRRSSYHDDGGGGGESADCKCCAAARRLGAAWRKVVLQLGDRLLHLREVRGQSLVWGPRQAGSEWL
jgi:hypothetical protein